MWIISRELAELIMGQNYAENAVYNPVEIDGVFIISEIEKNALLLSGYSEGDFELFVNEI